jgi:hypothetical protein
VTPALISHNATVASDLSCGFTNQHGRAHLDQQRCRSRHCLMAEAKVKGQCRRLRVVVIAGEPGPEGRGDPQTARPHRAKRDPVRPDHSGILLIECESDRPAIRRLGASVSRETHQQAEHWNESSHANPAARGSCDASEPPSRTSCSGVARA